MNTERVPQEPLVSVVTPVFNDADHLAECIESILAQTYTNWELLIVNNCSTDRSLEIAQSYASRDPRIRVYENEAFLDPAEVNFNSALRKMSVESRYCKFVLADDWIFPDCLTQMVRLAESHPKVGIVGAYGLKGRKVVWDGLPADCSVFSGRSLGRDHLFGKLYVFGNPTSVMMRSELVRACDPFYNESNTHSDTEKCYELLQSCDWGFVHQLLTYTRTRENSLRSFSERMNTHAPARISDLLKFGGFYLEESELKRLLLRRTLGYCRYLVRNALRFPEPEWWRYHHRKVGELRDHTPPLFKSNVVFGMMDAVMSVFAYAIPKRN